MSVDSGSGMNVHFLQFETVELVLDLLCQLWRQAVACRRFTPPVIHFRMECMVDGTLGRPIDISFFDRRRGYRTLRFCPRTGVEGHTSQNGSGGVHTRIGIRKIQSIRQRFTINVALER